jgi:hypothetical protein
MLGVPGIKIPNLSRTSRHFYNFMGVPNEPSGFRFSFDLEEKMMRGCFLDGVLSSSQSMKTNDRYTQGALRLRIAPACANPLRRAGRLRQTLIE